jgi:hypothetical protein
MFRIFHTKRLAGQTPNVMQQKEMYFPAKVDHELVWFSHGLTKTESIVKRVNRTTENAFITL